MSTLTNPAPRQEPRTKEQIAIELNISLSTLQRKIKKAGLEVPRGYISPSLQRLIYEKLGYLT